MTAPAPTFDELMATLAKLSTQLTGRDGGAIRDHVERLASVLAQTGPEAELRSRAAAELEQLVSALGRLGGAAHAPRGPDLGQLADGLRGMVAYLRAPTTENQAKVQQLIGSLPGALAPAPVPLDELKIDGTIEALAIEAARRHGLEGTELRRAVAGMQRDMAKLVGELERRAQLEASRMRTAGKFDQLIDQVIATRSPLGNALAEDRAVIVAAYRGVDLAHMAEGLRVFAEWLSTPADDPELHVLELRARFAEVLGPPTAPDPGRSEAERRADFERDIKVAVDQIFRATRPSS